MDLMLTYAATFSTIFFLAAVSIAVSTLTARPREAILRTYFWELLWLAWPILAIILTHPPAPYSTTLPHGLPGPRLDHHLESDAPDRGQQLRRLVKLLEPVLWMIGLQFLYGSLLLLWATLRLRPIERGSRLLFRGPISKADRPSPGFSGTQAVRRSADDLEGMFRRRSSSEIPPSRSSEALLLVVAIGALGYYAVGPGRSGAGRGLGLRLYQHRRTDLRPRSSSTPGSGFSRRSCTSCCCSCSRASRRRASRSSVRKTPGSVCWPPRSKEARSSSASSSGSIWRVRFVLGLLLAAWMFGVICGAVHPLAFLLIVALTAMDVVFVACLGCYVSLRMTSSARGDRRDDRDVAGRQGGLSVRLHPHASERGHRDLSGRRHPFHRHLLDRHLPRRRKLLSVRESGARSIGRPSSASV